MECNHQNAAHACKDEQDASSLRKRVYGKRGEREMVLAGRGMAERPSPPFLILPWDGCMDG